MPLARSCSVCALVRSVIERFLVLADAFLVRSQRTRTKKASAEEQTTLVTRRKRLNPENAASVTAALRWRGRCQMSAFVGRTPLRGSVCAQTVYRGTLLVVGDRIATGCRNGLKSGRRVGLARLTRRHQPIAWTRERAGLRTIVGAKN